MLNNLFFPHRVQLNVAGYEFFGQADLPQTAKHNAASQVSFTNCETKHNLLLRQWQ